MDLGCGHGRWANTLERGETPTERCSDPVREFPNYETLWGSLARLFGCAYVSLLRGRLFLFDNRSGTCPVNDPLLPWAEVPAGF